MRVYELLSLTKRQGDVDDDENIAILKSRFKNKKATSRSSQRESRSRRKGSDDDEGKLKYFTIVKNRPHKLPMMLR
jgi:hypothetical protein